MARIVGGDKLEAHLRGVAEHLARGTQVRIGFLEDATYPDGTLVPMVAAIQNFGAPANGIPARPFFTNMIEAKAGGWGGSMGRILVNQDYDGYKTLELMGKGIEGQLRQSIVDTVSPPLSGRTIERKGFNKPLVDTGHMLNSIDSEVE